VLYRAGRPGGTGVSAPSATTQNYWPTALTCEFPAEMPSDLPFCVSQGSAISRSIS